MERTVVLGTSIAPFNIELQKECVESWIKCGFKVVSYNCKDEINVLRDCFADMDVKFVEIRRSAKDLCGKELPYLQDILDGVGALSERVGGYFNSDIYFEHFTDGLYDYIYQEAKDSIIAVHRNEITVLEDIETMDWDINMDGIDGFFFDKKKISGLYGDWAYVQSVWDTFLLIMCKKKEIPVKTLYNPVAFHKRHKVRWDFARTQNTFDMVTCDYYANEANSRRTVFFDTYNHLYEYSKSIVYCENMNYKVLFIVDEYNEKQMASIREQKLKHFKIALNEEEGDFDFTFKIDKGVILDAAFCRFVFHLFETYHMKELEIGRFFVSNVENRMIFNQLNKNMPQLKAINRECNLFCRAITNKEDCEGIKTVYYPMCFEQIEILDTAIVDRVCLKGPTYIMPAGYRSGEWYGVNKEHLETVELEGFMDNDRSKVGGVFFGKKIHDAHEILEKNEEYNIILCTKYHQQAIREQVAHKETVQLLDADSVLWVDEKGELYVFNTQRYKNKREGRK